MESESYDLKSQIWENFHPSVKVLLSQMLNPNENERISAKIVKESDWVKNFLA